YTLDGETYDEAAFERRMVDNPPPVVDETLVDRALRAEADTVLELVVQLVDRPGALIGRQVRNQRLPEIEAMSASIRDIHRSARNFDRLTPAEEESLRRHTGGMIEPLDEARQARVDDLAGKIEQLEQAMRKDIRSRAEAAVAGEHERMRAEIATLGGKVIGALPVENQLIVRLPADQLLLLAEVPGVARIVEETPPELDLGNHSVSTGLRAGFWPNGLNGGIWDVGVLDTCLQAGHDNHDHVRFLTHDDCGTVDNVTGGHGTQVVGIIASDDGWERGGAVDIDLMLIGNLNNYRTNADWMVRSASDDAEVINTSFSWTPTSTSDYTNREQFVDGLIDNERVILSSSAGNRGNLGAGSITEWPRAYNSVSVANVNDQNTQDRDDDVITLSSGRGPTPLGRRKPDIAAPGTNTMTTLPNGGLGNFGGTSAAAPHVGAALILLNELRGSDDPMALKAALINAADAWTDNGTIGDTTDDEEVQGSEWNATYGWGYIDLFEAWLNGLDVFRASVDDGFSPAGLDFKLYRGRMFAGEKATLVWNRHVGYKGSNFPSDIENLTNLDLHAYRESNGSSLATSTSSRDNVEQIAVDATEDVILKVDVWGSIDPDVGIESFALATEGGFEAIDPPSFSFTANSPLFTPAGTPRKFTATVRNVGDVQAFSPRLTLNLPSGFTLISGARNRTLPTLAPGQSTTLSWTIRWDSCTSAGATATIHMPTSTSSFGEFLTTNGSKVVVCENLNQ
ncbi:MAG: S8 family serine peptidase, partial [Acidobacteriota bacterium]